MPVIFIKTTLLCALSDGSVQHLSTVIPPGIRRRGVIPWNDSVFHLRNKAGESDSRSSPEKATGSNFLAEKMHFNAVLTRRREYRSRWRRIRGCEWSRDALLALETLSPHNDAIYFELFTRRCHCDGCQEDSPGSPLVLAPRMREAGGGGGEGPPGCGGV